MSMIRVEITAEDIAACALVPDVGDGFKSTHPDALDPVEVAIARVTGQYTVCDGGDEVDGPELATIGARGRSARNTLIVSLPPEQAGWIERYYRGEAVEPFALDIEIEDWLVALVARAASTDEQALAVLRTEAAQ